MKRLGWNLNRVTRHRFTQACVLSMAVGLSQALSPVSLSGEELAAPSIANASSTLQETAPPTDFNSPGGAPFVYDPLAPTWADPVSQVPNFFGDFFAAGSRATGLATPLQYTGAGVEGPSSLFTFLQGPLTVNGPGGPFVLPSNIATPINIPNPDFVLTENAELTAQVIAAFPGATFVNGSGTYDFSNPTFDATFVYNYLSSAAGAVSANLPNPAGGGSVGRNRFFDNGSPIPHDRVYFDYTHANNVSGLASPFNVNRYVFGVEKTFFDGVVSIDFRLPFAGTADNIQISGASNTATSTEFGNLGLAFKTTLVRMPNFALSAGLGLSLPTASDSQILVGGVSAVEIQNRTVLLQPLIGAVWAPTDRFYAQSGLQFDLDPSGNPVRALNAGGDLARIGRLNDQEYFYFNNAIGYWLYKDSGSQGLTGIALQQALYYAQSFGSVDRVNNGVVNVADLNSSLNVVNGNTGAIFRFAERTNLALGVSYPLGGDRYYDWNLQAQLNYSFGR